MQKLHAAGFREKKEEKMRTAARTNGGAPCERVRSAEGLRLRLRKAYPKNLKLN